MSLYNSKTHCRFDVAWSPTITIPYHFKSSPILYADSPSGLIASYHVYLSRHLSKCFQTRILQTYLNTYLKTWNRLAWSPRWLAQDKFKYVNWFGLTAKLTFWDLRLQLTLAWLPELEKYLLPDLLTNNEIGLIAKITKLWRSKSFSLLILILILSIICVVT